MSPSLTQDVRTVADLNISPSVREHLTALLSVYADLKFDLDAIQHQLDIEKMAIGHILEEQGIHTLKDGTFALTWVRGSMTSKLDPKKLIAMGVTTAQLDAATVIRPRRDYFQIRDTNAKGDRDDA